MKKIYALITTLLVSTHILWSMDAAMYQWKSHFAYGEITHIEDAGNKIYGLASGALFAIDKSSEEIQTFSKQNGLNGGEIAQIGYDAESKTLLIAYTDGLVDFMKNNHFSVMTDLQQNALSASKSTNKIVIDNGLAYFCMPFGIMVVDIKNHLIKDTYYIGENGTQVDVLDLTIGEDSVYAISSKIRYSIGKKDEMMDYQFWHRTNELKSDSSYVAIAAWKSSLFIVSNQTLLQQDGSTWKTICNNAVGIRQHGNKMFVLKNQTGIYELKSDFSFDTIPSTYQATDVNISGTTYWLATTKDGIVRQSTTGTQAFPIDGPLINMPYRLRVAQDHLYMVAGQRWATEVPKRDANIMVYDIQKDTWINIPYTQVDEQCGMHIFDLMNVAADPNDAEHFYITTYGTGVIECQGDQVVKQYSLDNSPLESAAPGASGNAYVRTDGALFDDKGNLWLINAGVENYVHVATPAQLKQARQSEVAQWYKMMPRFTVGEQVVVNTPQEIFIDNRNSNWKWIPSARSASVGLILLDDHGTPQYRDDDETIYRCSFVDQDSKTTKFEAVYSIAQDKDGRIWMGIENGLITIPEDVDYKTSDRCERIKIARNDGTGLADYLLETERVTAIAVDGANRKWFGTQSSGVYLTSADGVETIEHFTEDNSPLLSNTILSIAIDPKTGRVFIGTSKGLISYQSDATTPAEEYSGIYAYPNPAYPEYDGIITITGLMDESIVHITDNAGNLVCETRSQGGTAIWDGKTADGKRVASGVYSVFLNENGNGQHAVTKIMVMH